MGVPHHQFIYRFSVASFTCLQRHCPTLDKRSFAHQTLFQIISESQGTAQRTRFCYKLLIVTQSTDESHCVGMVLVTEFLKNFHCLQECRIRAVKSRPLILFFSIKNWNMCFRKERSGKLIFNSRVMGFITCRNPAGWDGDLVVYFNYTFVNSQFVGIAMSPGLTITSFRRALIWSATRSFLTFVVFQFLAKPGDAVEFFRLGTLGQDKPQNQTDEEV